MITYTVETELKDFGFWSGAVDVAEEISNLDNADECWNFLEGMLEDNPTETQINDFVWFDALSLLEEYGYIPAED